MPGEPESSFRVGLPTQWTRPGLWRFELAHSMVVVDPHRRDVAS